MNLTELLFALLVALNLADIVSTLKVLRAGGKELNPVMRKAMKAVGTLPALVLLKAPVLAGVYYVLVPPEMWVAMGASCLFYMGVVANNIRQ